ncbi:hypothetical protein K490DRAFT_65718 [Saccharata proteae CBS 121410]|uniref:Uncharacterized protein n=1 Tax=Saccharata proteae CBS 121410 TaxID=1314787 RepID=A0A9P4HVQ4_9PEZI|nr:hypothetical protein K490DRAFT_65718 [Saccharata proteae CBS 121410]
MSTIIMSNPSAWSTMTHAMPGYHRSSKHTTVPTEDPSAPAIELEELDHHSSKPIRNNSITSISSTSTSRSNPDDDDSIQPVRRRRPPPVPIVSAAAEAATSALSANTESWRLATFVLKELIGRAKQMARTTSGPLAVNDGSLYLPTYPPTYP